jgi:hypothetical protein
MIDTALFTPELFFLLLAFLVVMPFLTVAATWFIIRVYTHDTGHPRNKILKRMRDSGISIAAVSILIGWIALGYWIRFFQGRFEPQNVDFGGLALAAAFVVLEIQPWLNYRSLSSLDGNVILVAAVPEKEDELDKDNDDPL